MGKFVIKKRINGDFQFNLEADNSPVILTSEGYSSKNGCTSGIESVRKNAPDNNRYEKKISSNQKHFFNLKAGNGEIIGTSEMYESTYGRDIGIASVKANATDATVEYLA